MPRKPLSDKSETTRLEIRIPAALKEKAKSKYGDISAGIRALLELDLIGYEIPRKANRPRKGDQP